MPSLSCCFCDRSFYCPQQLQLHLTHTHPHLSYTFQCSSSSSSVFIITVSRPPLCQDPAILFSWVRHAPHAKETSRKGKKKAAAAVATGGGAQRQYFHSVSWLPISPEGGGDSCELDMSWLHAEQERMINDFEDVG
jgi:hypothetical protein